MNRKVSLIYFFVIIPHLTFSNDYEAGLKLEAQGQIAESLVKYNNYIDLNLNSPDQDTVIDKIIHASTLFDNIEESINYLVIKTKKIKNPDTRSIIYKRIAELYELTGKIFNAGIYYEKSAFVKKSNIDYFMLLNSYDMLLEVGYYQKVNSALEKIDIEKLNTRSLHRYYLLKSRVLTFLGNESEARENLKIISSDNYLARYELEKKRAGYYLDNSTMYYDTLYKGLELKTPGSYNNLQPIEIKNPKKSENNIKNKVFIGSYDQIPPGIINILEQVELHWIYKEHKLFVVTEDINSTIKVLEKAGIGFEDIR